MIANMVSSEVVSEFRAAMERAGLPPPAALELDGRLHRFSTNGAPTNKDGWFVFHGDDVPAGAFGCWRQNISEKWSAAPAEALTPSQRDELRRRLDLAQQQRQEVEAQRHAEAAQEAQQIWDVTDLAPHTHPYLTRKKVGAHGLRIGTDGRLIVPVRDLDGRLHTLQFIDGEGVKRFLPGGKVESGSFQIGEIGQRVCLAEGFATGAAIHAATGAPVAVAFHAGNLLPVARALREKHPDVTIVVCGDNDISGVGQEKARHAAQVVSGVLLIPGETGMDWNDVSVQQGPAVVQTAFEQAVQAHPTSPAFTPTIKPTWPTLDPLAIRGVIGEIVRAIEPHSEADPAAILIQSLVAFGSAINRNAHFMAEADAHHTNLFAVLVGETAKGRKGTSFGHVQKIFESIDLDWALGRIQGGLSSGERLIYSVRDGTDENGLSGADAAVEDKRLLVYDSEFGRTLKAMRRDGNTLSAVLRQAWDTGTLRTMVKKSPDKATKAHISVIAHVTKDELLRLIAGDDYTNGFANRFIWCCVRRSKILPEGGIFHEQNIDPLVHRLRQAVQFARATGRLDRDDAARAIWRHVYPKLSEGLPGLLGAITSRSEAQVMRLALLYSLQDLSSTIRPEHLNAALAVWEFCESSARYIFGDRLGDAIADEILSALRATPDGLTRTDIRDLFGRHRRSGEIERSLSSLTTSGLVRREVSRSGGRPVERWFATSGDARKAT